MPDRTPAPQPGSPPRHPRLRRIERLSYLLDNAIRIPGIGYRIGYDAILGLVPGLGDAMGLAFSTYIVVEAARFGLPKATLARMVANVGVEALAGVVPLLGDVFDATWKANARNMRLLHERLEGDRPRQVRTDRRFLYAVVGVLVLLAAVLGAVVVLLFAGILALFGG